MTKNVAKKKAPASKGSAAGVALAFGVACAAGGYFAGRNSEAIEPKIMALVSREKTEPAPQPARPASEPKRAEAPTHAVKPADKAELARILRGGEAKSDPRPPADIPAPPVKPELARAAAVRAEAARPQTTEQPAPIAFALMDKEIVPGGEEGDRVKFALSFENLAGKPIRAFEGVMKLSDGQDALLYSSKISVSALIAENGALRWEQHVDAKRLDDKGRRIVSEDKDNLRAVFLVKKVFFADGSVQNYATPPRAAQAG